MPSNLLHSDSRLINRAAHCLDTHSSMAGASASHRKRNKCSLARKPMECRQSGTDVRLHLDLPCFTYLGCACFLHTTIPSFVSCLKPPLLFLDFLKCSLRFGEDTFAKKNDIDSSISLETCNVAIACSPTCFQFIQMHFTL